MLVYGRTKVVLKQTHFIEAHGNMRDFRGKPDSHLVGSHDNGRSGEEDGSATIEE
jgi:hypothetical protein